MGSEPLDLDLIEARCNAATPGPWEWWSGNPWHADAPNHPLREEIAPGFKENSPTVFQTGITGHGFFYREGVQAQAKKDTAFIAAAREDVPALIAEIRELRKENGRLRQKVILGNPNRYGQGVAK
jgi:hypothetical protein